MYDDNTNKNKLIKSLLGVAPKHCDNCGAKYSESDFKVIKNSASNTILHLRCQSCGNAYMLNVMNPVNGVVGAQRTPVNMDLNQGDEVQRFAGQSAVERDEAIDILGELNQNFKKEQLEDLFS